jgi:hypothetical protein
MGILCRKATCANPKVLKNCWGYVEVKYNIKVADIPVTYVLGSSQYPDPVKDKAKRPQFETAGQQYQHDLKVVLF